MWIDRVERRYVITGSVVGVIALLALVYFLIKRGPEQPKPKTTAVKQEVTVKPAPPGQPAATVKQEVTVKPPASPAAKLQVKTETVVKTAATTCAPQNYKVARGDSLWRIARRQWGGRPYFWPVLAETNKLRNPNLIRIGQTLVIPCLCDLPPLVKKASVKMAQAAPDPKPKPKPEISVPPQAECGQCGSGNLELPSASSLLLSMLTPSLDSIHVSSTFNQNPQQDRMYPDDVARKEDSSPSP